MELITTDIRSSTPERSLHPTQGNCGICFWTRNSQDFENVEVFTFVEGSPGANQIQIGTTLPQQATFIQSALAALTTIFNTAPLFFSPLISGNGINLQILAPDPSVDFSFDLFSNAPISYYNIFDKTETTGQYISRIEVKGIPSVGDYIVLNPPPKDVGLSLHHVWNFAGSERHMISNRVPALFEVDTTANRLDTRIHVDVAPILNNYIYTPQPRFLNFTGEETVAYLEPEFSKQIRTYYSYNFEGQEDRTDMYRSGQGGAIIIYNTDYYWIHNGRCSTVDGTTIPWDDYAKDSPSPVKFLGVSGSNRYVCKGDVLLGYLDLPDPLITSLDITYDTDEIVPVTTFVNYQNGTADGMHSFNFTRFLDGTIPATATANTLTIKLEEPGGWESESLLYTVMLDSCEECCEGTQFLFLSSFGIYESFRLKKQSKENFKGKAVDITYDISCISDEFSHTSVIRHKNRGIVSEETEYYQTFRFENNIQNVLMFREFVTSTQVYKVNGYDDLEPMILEPANYVIETNKNFFQFEIKMKKANKITYTDNIF